MFDLGHSGQPTKLERKDDLGPNAPAERDGANGPVGWRKKNERAPLCNRISTAPRASSDPSAHRPAPFEVVGSVNRTAPVSGSFEGRRDNN